MALVEKDGAPAWSHACLDEVTDTIIENYFRELGDNKLLDQEGTFKTVTGWVEGENGEQQYTLALMMPN